MYILKHPQNLKFSILILICIFIMNIMPMEAQNDKKARMVIVDEDGIMKWSDTNTEVRGFGVNYSVPFAHAYRSAKKMGVDVKKAIENDVYHFKRLGFDLYRLHVWDTEISDADGNLLDNEHLDAFDYLLKTLKDHNINYVITPIAFWGNGWPEPDTETPGFSNKYGKNDCLSNDDCIKAQQNYLFQFLNHVNPYTGVAYKDEPNVIAFEVSNEPHHRGEGGEVTRFVKGMVKSMRKTGTNKPIFYNTSHGVHFMDDYFKGDIQGGTFQWYPTGLGYQRELPGNLLPNVDKYDMPFDEVFKKHQGAKLVYEFDAADVNKSYIYPAMARSFRTAGIQIATHFAYDPTYLAFANTEYNTHYMNLAYTPQKALALKIASEVFHKVPLNKSYGVYPQNMDFDDFKVDYNSDLAEYNSGEKFFYTNSTTSTPKNEGRLNEIAGSESSPIVTYNGTGAYFLDKIEHGIWRLELMPDAVHVRNPYGRNSLDKTVGVVQWNTNQMTLKLKDLGDDFNIEALNEENNFEPKVEGQSFSIRPGTYILYGKSADKNWQADKAFKTYQLQSFFAPETTVDQPFLVHHPLQTSSQNQDIEVNVLYVSAEKTDSIKLLGFNNSERFDLKFKKLDNFNYIATIPASKVNHGFMRYNIEVFDENSTRSYPSNKEGNKSDWDFYDQGSYTIRILPKEFPITLFSAEIDTDLLVRQWRIGSQLVPTQNFSESEYQIYLENLFSPDNENLKAEPIYDYSMKHFILDNIAGRRADLAAKNKVVLRGRSLNGSNEKVQIAFVLDDGSAFGKTVEMGPELKDYSIDLSMLKPVETVTLPRPYPSFLPYYLEHSLKSTFDIERIESLQISIGPELSESEKKASHSLGIISIILH